MCYFFSSLYDGKDKYLYFSAQQRRDKVCFKNGECVVQHDSHARIAKYFGVNEYEWNKLEYDPFTQELTIDNQVTDIDKTAVQHHFDAMDWRDLCGDVDGARKFIKDIKTIPWLKPDGTIKSGDGIKLFETQAAARDAALAAALTAARDAAWASAWDGSYDAARAAARAAAFIAAWNATWDVAWDVAWYAAWAASWDAERDFARDAARTAILYCRIKYVCAGLGIDKKHIDHIARRWNVWRHGYSVYCDVDGVLYCYKSIV